MPPWQAVLNDDGVAKMADYVMALAGGTASADSETATTYRTYCGACHGADGAGIALLGAPALNDSVWLYGGSTRAVRESIARGRTGVMPPFGRAARRRADQASDCVARERCGATPGAVATGSSLWRISLPDSLQKVLQDIGIPWFELTRVEPGGATLLMNIRIPLPVYAMRSSRLVGNAWRSVLASSYPLTTGNPRSTSAQSG